MSAFALSGGVAVAASAVIVIHVAMRSKRSSAGRNWACSLSDGVASWNNGARRKAGSTGVYTSSLPSTP